MAMIVVLSAPSGTGKTTLVNILREIVPELVVSVSYTTRKPRQDERNGIDYHFISRRAFKALIRRGFFAEWACVYGNYYGTSKSFLEKNLSAGNKILLTIDTQGGLQIKNAYPDALLIGILPPSQKEQGRRLARRGEDTKEMEKRLQESARERRMLRMHYHIRVVNKNIAATAERLAHIIKNWPRDAEKNQSEERSD